MKRWTIAAALALLAVIAVALVPIALDALERRAERSDRAAAVAAHLQRADAAVAARAWDEAAQAVEAARLLAPHSDDVRAAWMTVQVERAARLPLGISAGEVATLGYAARVLMDARPAARVTAGHLAARVGRGDAALALYQSAVERDPAYVPAHLGVASIHRSRGAPTLALKAFEAAVAAAPTDSLAMNNLAVHYADLERPDDAIATFERALEHDDTVMVRESLANVLLARDRRAEAIAHLQRAVALAPDRVPLRRRLAAHLHEAGRDDEAIKLLAATLKQQPDHAAVAYELGVLLSEGGDRLGADRALTHFLSLAGDDPAFRSQAVDARRRIAPPPRPAPTPPREPPVTPVSGG